MTGRGSSSSIATDADHDADGEGVGVHHELGAMVREGLLLAFPSGLRTALRFGRAYEDVGQRDALVLASQQVAVLRAGDGREVGHHRVRPEQGSQGHVEAVDERSRR